MWRKGVVLATSLLLAGCVQSIKPASVAGECNVFTDPGFQVRGRTRVDQRWIASTQEKGIQVCGWERPRPIVEPKATLKSRKRSLHSS